jgi:hypothetical protein
MLMKLTEEATLQPWGVDVMLSCLSSLAAGAYTRPLLGST